ncbi:MAG: hypothetical protein CL844_04615 [Crocinitomicaceae bacterium]|nr:hypothetical protein [Crocinitomicaceae bacterium]|tara:strand:+ start:67028 stop:67939 length:912 start_codon:yes stop_codon:yes gene_type:complete
MLNTESIAKKIKSPELINSDDLKSLENLSIKYPYSQIFSILYLKGLGITKNIRFEEELKKHSYKVTDRIQLYKLIHEYSNGVSVSDDISISDNNQIEQSKKQLDNTEVVVEETKNEEILSKQKTDSSQENKNEEKLNANILYHTVRDNYELPKLTEEEITRLNTRIKPITSLKQEGKKEEQKEELKIREQKKSFNSWINLNHNYSSSINYDEKEKNITDFNQEKQLYGEILKPKKAFFSPLKQAKESLNEDNIPVSETLAKIYAMQGNFPQAIKAYKELSLKNPEKKIFFANLIEELTNKLNK